MSNEAPKPPAQDPLNPDNLYADGTPVAAPAETAAAAPETLLAAQPKVKPDNLYADSSPKD